MKVGVKYQDKKPDKAKATETAEIFLTISP